MNVLVNFLSGPLNDGCYDTDQDSSACYHEAGEPLFDSQGMLCVDCLTHRSRTIARHAVGFAGIGAQHGFDRTLQVRAEEDIDAIFGYTAIQILG